MSEIAVPVVEAAQAPATPIENVAEPKRRTLSYDPANLPTPTTAHDFYLRAQLVEARALRSTLQDLVRVIQQLLDMQAETKPHAATGATQKLAK